MTVTVRSSSPAGERQVDVSPGLVGPDGHDQRDPVGDPAAVERGDHVALLEAGVVRGRARDDLADLGALAVPVAPVTTLAPMTG